MEVLVVIFIVIVILGALRGSESFGETIKSGCGCLTLIVIAFIVAGAIL